MTLKKNARLLFAFSFVAIFGSFLIESESQAQYFRRPPGQELGRFLGLGYGNGYHCRTPGPQTDYYNPYSAHNSHLVSRNQASNRYSNLNTGYAIGGMNRSVSHLEYTATQPDSYSVFEGLPGNTVSPSFEPVNKKEFGFQKDLEDRDFEDELDLDEDDDMENEDDFSSSFEDEQDSAVNREQEDDESGAFESLREQFDSLDSEGSSLKEAAQPSEEDQAAFFGSNFGGN